MNKIDFFIEMMEELGYAEVEVNQKLYPIPEWASHQIIRSSGLVEDICIHGIGHPNIGWLKIHDPSGSKCYAYHCCDGCCLK